MYGLATKKRKEDGAVNGVWVRYVESINNTYMCVYKYVYEGMYIGLVGEVRKLE